MEEDVAVRYVFMAMLAISDPQGYVIGTDVAIARRLNIPLKLFLRCLDRLKQPDADSNSPDEDGRRILDSDGERGYRMVNFLKYRSMRDENDRREYQRTYRAKYREEGRDKQRPVNGTVNSGQYGQPQSTQAEGEGEEERDARGISPLTPIFSPPAWEQVKAEAVRLLFPEDQALRFFKEMESVGWIDGMRRPLRNWRIYLSKKVDFWRDSEGKKKAKDRLKAEQKAEKEAAKKTPARTSKVEPIRGFDD